MRIHEHSHTQFSYKKLILWVLGLGLLMCAVYLGYQLSTKESKNSNAEYYCDAEVYSDGKFTTGADVYTTNCFQDKTEFVSGMASCRCEGDKIYGPTLSLDHLNPGDTVYVSLQQKSTGNAVSNLIFSSDRKHYHQETMSKGGDTQWQKYSTKYIIPEDAIGAVWKIYPAMISGSGPAYYDDIEIGTQAIESDTTAARDFPTVKMQINSINFKKIKAKREEAKKAGLLFSSKDDLVDANVKTEGKTYKIQTRLKGDLLDHLRSDKWSFRVILDGKDTWRGMNIFSIHNSRARSHLAEWSMHQLMRSEGIISPKYDFMRFVLNDKTIGVYAYEQHFDNYFLTENKKLIAPIIRHNDDGYWDNVHGKLKNYEWAEASQIELFNKENSGNQEFMNLYNYGHSQLNDYLDGRKKAEEVFDLDKMAKYYALMEIGHGLHAQLMTNIRFYVNPTSGILEPIGYDFFGDHMPNVTEDWRPIGQWENGKNIIERSRDGYAYMRRLFGDLTFYELYMRYLDQYSSDAYIDGKLLEWKDEIAVRNEFINEDPEYKNYRFDFKYIFRKAGYTRAKMYPLPNVSLKSYRSSDKQSVVLQGFHYFPLKVIGYITDKKTTMVDQPILIDAYSPDAPVVSYIMDIQGKANTIIYQTLGIDSLFYHDINNDTPPQLNIPTQQSLTKNIASVAGVVSKGSSHLVNTNKWIIDTPIIVPEGHELNIPKGTSVTFRSGGSLTVNGRILAIGTQSAPIVFEGAKSSGHGLLISQSKEENVFSHCLFSNLGEYNVGAVSLPASINIDQSEVSIDNCKWTNNNARADLILSNTEYTMERCQFSNNAGDAIRSVFSTGRIDQLTISNYGGQGIIQHGGRINGKQWSLDQVLGWAYTSDLMAILSLDNYSISETNHSIKTGGSTETVIKNYTGKTILRDIEVTGSGQPQTKVIIANANDPKRLEYIVEPGALLRINGSVKKTK